MDQRRSLQRALGGLGHQSFRVGLALVVAAPVARADERRLPLADASAFPTDGPTSEGPELTLAETLYREGRRLLGEKNYVEAAAKLAESYRLDPGIGTLLSLAICHEAQGKLATAWLEFGDAMRAAQRENRDDRVQLAREHLVEIERRLSRLTISVDAGARPSGLVVRLDGVQIRAAAEGVAVPIDPGPHTIEATAPGKRPWREKVVIGADSDQRVVVIRELVDQSQTGLVTNVASPPQGAADQGSVGGAAGSSTAMYISGWVTLALIGGAIGTGIAYHDAKRSYESLLAEEEAPSNSLDEQRSAALRLGWINAGLTVGAALGVGLTTYLYWIRPAGPVRKGASGLQVAPWGTRSAAGVSVASEF